MNDYYVYIHKRKDTGEVFYVGQGRLNRAFISHKRSAKWKNVVDSANGFEIEYLFTNLSKDESVTKENYLLANPKNDWNLINSSGVRQVNILKVEMFDKLYYNPQSASGLSWKIKSSNNTKNSLEAGYKDKRGYFQVRVDNKLYAAHRIVWLLVNGNIDHNKVINHIDNNPSNNNISNLEQVTSAINARKAVHNKNPANTGVLYSKTNNGYEYWTGFYHDLQSKRYSKNFNCAKYGFDAARNMALSWRLEKLQELNRLGAGYNV